jgi:N-acetylmuramoyl-L-alanine amidase
MRYKYSFILIFILLANFSFGQLQGIKICIDPGHGGHDPANDRKINLPHGLVFWESEGNLMTAFHEKDLLESLGASVKMTRTANDNSDDISLSSRVAIANAFGADYFQSNHTNAGSSGINYSLVLFNGTDSSPTWPDAKVMGSIIGPNLQDLLRTTRNYNRGDRSFLGFNLGVLRNTNMPATLSEGSFHDIPDEALRLKNTEYSRNYAWALVKSFCKYFNVDGFPTGRIGGIVTNRHSGDVINNIQVTCQPGNITYIGDDFYNGFYGFDLAPGTYTLTFSRNGFFDVEKTITIVANKYQDLDVSLPLNLNGAPYADFEIFGLPAGALDTVIFDASNSYDDGQIVKYEWFLNDSIALDTGKIIKYVFVADGQYNVTLKLTDDDDKTSSLTKSVKIATEPPKIPELMSVEYINGNKGVKIKWKKNTQSSLAGYRLYYNINPFLENLNILADTNVLKPDVTEFEIDSLGNDNMYVFWIQAINKAGYASESSDMYGVMHYPFGANKKLLIVDGFHRRSSYPEYSHTFASGCYLTGLWDALGHVDVSTAMNQSIMIGKVKLSDYDMVIWFLGDESSIDETFNAVEQNKVKDYLNQGGKLFVTGSEIGWDLDHKGTSTDKNFYHNYLKANFVEDGSAGRAPARGISGGEFDGVTLHYGEVYIEDYPDVIAGTGGAESILKYNQGAIAGVAYKGAFGSSTTPGAVVYIGFPLETVSNRYEIEVFMEKLLNYFDATTSNNNIFDNDERNNFKVYPTVFNNRINLLPNINIKTPVEIDVYNLNGNQVYSTKTDISKGVAKEIMLNAISDGIYILKIKDKNREWNYKILKH